MFCAFAAAPLKVADSIGKLVSPLLSESAIALLSVNEPLQEKR